MPEDKLVMVVRDETVTVYSEGDGLEEALEWLKKHILTGIATDESFELISRFVCGECGETISGVVTEISPLPIEYIEDAGEMALHTMIEVGLAHSIASIIEKASRQAPSAWTVPQVGTFAGFES